MIKIVAKARIKADKIEDFKAAAKELVLGSRAEEGNVSYSLNMNVKDPQEFAIIEMWKDPAAIEAHKKAPHFTGTGPKIAACAEAPMTLDVFTEIEL